MRLIAVLCPGGTVLTIQSGTEWRGETLADALCGTPPEWTEPGSGWAVGDSFRQAGFRIIGWTEHAWSTTYHDSAAVVYELLRVPWTIVDFDMARYRERSRRGGGTCRSSSAALGEAVSITSGTAPTAARIGQVVMLY